MANTSSELLVGASGSLYLAATGTTLPTTEAASLDAAFKDVGYVDEDGVTWMEDRSIKKIFGWQSFYALRTLIESRSLKVSMNLLQWNELNIVTAFGGGTVTEPTSGHYKFVPPDPEDVYERAAILDWADGSYLYRLVLPKVTLVDSFETKLMRTDVAKMPVAFEVINPGTGTDPFTLYTDDPSFEA